MIAIAKTVNLVTDLASLLVACKYWHAEHSFGYTQFNAHEDGFIVHLPASLVAEASSVWFTRLINLCGFDTIMAS